MKELITLDQANHIMWIVLVAAPIVGAIWGAASKRLKQGVVAGLIVGAANLVMWNVYNGITDRLGLDTVKNLLVNLALFIAIGVVGGLVWGRMVKPVTVEIKE
jgi:hypothetical protein